ncbi:cupin-like domain-containing protein [Sorangium sp. So ce1389]|uniref:cupin-like domain-containing protein n=1 Tax=Sorangium sp. So ce1389 TaxID=3133336 RepID=UPI003F64365C
MQAKTQASCTIERRAARPEAEFYRDLERRGEPVVLTGAVDAWPARSKWCFDWFRATHGDVTAPVEWLKYCRSADGSVERVGRVEMMRVRDYVDALVADDGRLAGGYLIGRDLFARLPGLLADAHFPRVEVNERLTERLIFMGPRGAFTQLHYDRAHNLHAMLVGCKRWQLYAPDRTPELHPARYEFPYSVISENDLAPRGGDPQRLPGGVKPDHDFVLEQGEVLYLPYGWWHRVETLAPSIATNLWWLSWQVLAEHGPGLVRDIAAGAVRAKLRRYEQITAGRRYRNEA